MLNIRRLAAEIILREGGFVDDPDDPGGATNHGVTVHTMRRLGLDLDGDGDVDAADVRTLTREKATEIFIDHYFYRPGIDLLPEPLWPSLFDMYVNAGANAVRLLQRLLCDMGAVVQIDGAIGPQTQSATRTSFQAAPAHFVDAYGIARRNYYFDLADRRPASRKFARRKDGGKGGWITRAEMFIAAKYHLNAIEFDKRVAAWG